MSNFAPVVVYWWFPCPQASADKIANEMAQFGNPPVFPVVSEADAAAAATAKAAEKAADAKNADPTKFVAKKSKAQAKVGGGGTS